MIGNTNAQQQSSGGGGGSGGGIGDYEVYTGDLVDLFEYDSTQANYVLKADTMFILEKYN